MKENWIYRRGDIYLVDLGTNVGSEQGGCRPVLLLQNDVGNHFAPTLIVAPVSSRYWKKLKQPTHSLIEGIQNLTSPSVVLAEQIITIDKKRVMKYLGKVSEEQMQNIDKAVKSALDWNWPLYTHLTANFRIVMNETEKEGCNAICIHYKYEKYRP